jgi:hypothetical protein
VAETPHPTAAWVWQQVVEVTARGRRPPHLIRDPDRFYGGDFRDRAKALGIAAVLTPVCATPVAYPGFPRMRVLIRRCMEDLFGIRGGPGLRVPAAVRLRARRPTSAGAGR